MSRWDSNLVAYIENLCISTLPDSTSKPNKLNVTFNAFTGECGVLARNKDMELSHLTQRMYQQVPTNKSTMISCHHTQSIKNRFNFHDSGLDPATQTLGKVLTKYILLLKIKKMLKSIWIRSVKLGGYQKIPSVCMRFCAHCMRILSAELTSCTLLAHIWMHMHRQDIKRIGRKALQILWHSPSPIIHQSYFWKIHGGAHCSLQLCTKPLCHEGLR